MSCRLVVVPEAHADIRRFSEWWAQCHSILQAVKWMDCVYDQIDNLRHAPHSHPLSSENDQFPFELRDRLLGVSARPTHRAIFTIHDDTVYILAVRHVAQDRLRPTDLSPHPWSDPPHVDDQPR